METDGGFSRMPNFKTEIGSPSGDDELWLSIKKSACQMSEFNRDWKSEGEIQWAHQESDQMMSFR